MTRIAGGCPPPPDRWRQVAAGPRRPAEGSNPSPETPGTLPEAPEMVGSGARGSAWIVRRPPSTLPGVASACPGFGGKLPEVTANRRLLHRRRGSPAPSRRRMIPHRRWCPERWRQVAASCGRLGSSRGRHPLRRPRVHSGLEGTPTLCWPTRRPDQGDSALLVLALRRERCETASSGAASNLVRDVSRKGRRAYRAQPNTHAPVSQLTHALPPRSS